MAVKKDIRITKNKKDGSEIKKTFWECEGNYIDSFGRARRYHKRGFAKEKDAKAYERLFLNSAKDSDSLNITFRELFDLYINNRVSVIKQRSISDIKYTAEKHILPFWGKIKIKSITRPLIMKWQQELVSITYTHKNKTNENNEILPLRFSNDYLVSIQGQFKTIMTFGIKMGIVTDGTIMTFDFIKNNNELKKEMLFWHPSEYFKFINEVDDAQYTALFNILYWCGLRIGEVLALTWNDVDLINSSVTIKKTYDQKNRVVTAPKTSNSNRCVLMPMKCLESLKTWQYECSRLDGYHSNTYIFGFNKPLDDNTIRRKKDKWCVKANVTKIRIHDFRHSHVSLLINQGFNAFDIAKRLGHTVDMVNNRYSHWFDSSQKKMVDALNNVL